MFINSHNCDAVVIVGDFNVDFNPHTDHSLCSCGLPFQDNVMFTYEHDDGLNRSWIDHILCS